MTTTDATMQTFFESPSFAVVGASTDPAKFGHKVFSWYANHNLPATPINPRAPTIAVGATEHPTAAALSALPSPKSTSVSFITPPAVTLKALQEAKELGVPAVWLQPGAYDDAVLAFARAEGNFRAVVAGTEGPTRGGQGWCILVDGERGLKAVGKLGLEERL